MERYFSTLTAVLAVFVMLLGHTTVQAADSTFGRTDIATLTSAGLSADFKRGSRYEVKEPATVHYLCAYLDGFGGASGEQRIRYALYRDSGGRPAEKLAESAENVIVANYAGGWICGAVADTTIDPGFYWIALHTSGTAGVIRDRGDGNANWFGNADAYADTASNPFGAGNAGNGTLSAYALYSSPLAMTRAGRTTIGTRPSAGMSANFKRASSFTITTRGRLGSMSAYLDGQGGVIGTQQHRYVLYRDANGVPGEKVAESQLFGLSNQTRAGWYTDETLAPEILEPGKYWFAIHTNGPAGVLRNYSDGVGNWYGNSDTFADGAASSFGAGNPGDGTLSAYITYDTRKLRVGQVGRTDVAMKPSAGLRANAMRGSMFVYNNNGAVLNTLSAYLDGLGGAAGSQKVRMAVYIVSDKMPTGYPLWHRIAESQEVTIAAGTPPAWVHFPVTATPLDSGIPVFYIMIESGATGGVVRDYGDGAANWLSTPITYTQGAPAIFYEDSTVTYGDVTLSVYGTFTEPSP